MGTDLESLANSDQPMAQIFANAFGQKATLGIWIVVVLIQCVSSYFDVSIFSLTLNQVHDGVKYGKYPFFV
jgi:hypothetical protein